MEMEDIVYLVVMVDREKKFDKKNQFLTPKFIFDWKSFYRKISLDWKQFVALKIVFLTGIFYFDWKQFVGQNNFENLFWPKFLFLLNKQSWVRSPQKGVECQMFGSEATEPPPEE